MYNNKMLKFNIFFILTFILLFGSIAINSETVDDISGYKVKNEDDSLSVEINNKKKMQDNITKGDVNTVNIFDSFENADEYKKYDASSIIKSDKYSSKGIYFILAGILIIISILSTLIVRDCIVERIRLKNDSFLQAVMDTVFRQAACIFLSITVSYCLLTSRLIDLIREYCENLMSDYSSKTIINNIATQIDDVIVNNSKVWTTENLAKEFNNILAIVILTFSWYCVFVLLFTASVKFLEKWIRYADNTDVGALIKSIYRLRTMFSLNKFGKKRTLDYQDYFGNGENNCEDQKMLGEVGKNNSIITLSENKGSIQENIPITVLQGGGSTSSYKLSLNKNESLSERGQIETERLIDVEKNESMNYLSEADIEKCTDINSSLSSESEIEERDISIVEDEMKISQFNDSIELENKPNIPCNSKSKRDSVSSKRKKQIGKASNIKLTWKEQISKKLSLFFDKIWILPNEFLLTYMKAHFVSLRYDFMDEIATYDNYGSFSSGISDDTCSSFECQNSSWLISLTDPTTSLVAGVYFTEYLRAKLLILAVSLIRIPITTLSFVFFVNLICWLCVYNYHYNIIAFNNTKHYFSEPMICFYISVILFGFSLIVWLESWLVKRNLQPKNILEYLKMKYSLDVGIPQQEIEYEKIMPRYKIGKAKLSKKKESMCKGGGYSQLSTQPCNLMTQGTLETDYLDGGYKKETFSGRLSKYINNKLFGTNNPTLHDNLFLFKKNGPNILLRWFQASYFIQLVLISIVIHLSHLQKELWFEEFQLVTMAIWCIFILQNMCLPFMLYPILLCTSVGQMADKLVLEQVLSIQKTQNIQRLTQISESLRFYSFIFLFKKGNEVDKELQRRKYSIVAKTAPWELQVRCRNTMNFLINNAPIKTQVSFNL
ncbi:hypothetical protein FG386_003023 [Cryptosporidium ryanae]|uniref:uncharacterized protein n=1 Tax=Cryptosporidium ryanae TaxID=515981 RepID=UPI003519E902|nr:hypothetical protein FG386_003023 [Cryptosporidium ryanae]